MLAHVAGSLGEAHRLLIATHLAGCARCRAEVLMLQHLAGEALFALRLEEAGASSLADILVRLGEPTQTRLRSDRKALMVAGTILPPLLSSLRPSRVRWLGPGVRHARLLRNCYGTLHLLRVSPGVALPQHAHRGLELTCVLEGAFADSDRHHGPGDLSEAVADTHHAPVATGSTDCVCIISTSGRLRFSGWLGRLMQPFLPF